MGKYIYDEFKRKEDYPFTKLSIFYNVIDYVSYYTKQERPLTKSVDSTIRDKILIRITEHMMHKYGFRLSLGNDVLKTGSNRFNENVDDEQLFYTVLDNFSDFLFDKDVLSIVWKDKSHACKNIRRISMCSVVFLDFINYLANVLGFDKVFTLKDLLDRYNYRKHLRDMSQLKKFLEDVEYYGLELANQRPVQMNEKNQDAIAYAVYKYGSDNDNVKKLSRNASIKKRIISMKQAAVRSHITNK